MNRFSWCDGSLEQEEKELRKQKGITLYDGDKQSFFVGGDLTLTSHRLLWTGPGKHLSLLLSLVVFVEQESGGWSKSDKIIVHVGPPTDDRHSAVVQNSPYNYIKLSFRSGGASEFFAPLQDALSRKEWQRLKLFDIKGRKIRAGIAGIERQIQEKHDQAEKNISVAFEDLSKLMEMAKEMVTLSRSIVQKLKEKGSEITDDETVTFKSHLLSLGISDPVTKSAYGSGSAYHKELAKQLAEVLEQPVRDAGGVLALTDVYCRINRARGLELLSPEDLLNACKMMDLLKLPLRLHVFDSGVTILQLATHNELQMAVEVRDIINEKGSLSAEELSLHVDISVVLARERLFNAERQELACRDDSVEGLRFYPNWFLEKE